MVSGKNPTFRRFDFFNKAVDGVRDVSLFGAIVSILSLMLMASLFLSELWSYILPETVSHMVVNTNHGITETSIFIHITLPYVPCNAIAIKAENTRGGPLTGSGSASEVTQRLPDKSEMKLISAAWPTAVPSGACTIEGKIKVAKVGGSVSINVNGATMSSSLNLDHFIHRLYFGNGIPEALQQLPLNMVTVKAPDHTGLTTYTLRAVETAHRRGRKVTEWYQYSARSDYEKMGGKLMNAVKDKRSNIGVKFAYDFTAVSVVKKDNVHSFTEFFTSTCAIVGGIFTVSGLLVGFFKNVKHSVKGD